MQAVILAGGKGTRLRPYTTVLPKPLMPLGDWPILEIILRQLHGMGVRRVILAVGYMGQLFRAFFENGERLGLEITYVFEERPLGTAGPLGAMLGQLDDDFLIMNGDLLTTLSYQRLFEFHRTKAAAATIGLSAVRSMSTLESSRPSARPFLTPGAYLDLPDLMLKLLGAGENVYCYRESCEWLDIGRMDDYQRAVEVFEARRAEFLPGEP